MSDPIQSRYRDIMNEVAGALDFTFNGASGGNIVFTLFIAESGKMNGGRVNFISNGCREDMISMVREWLSRADGGAIDALGSTVKQ